ncbi:MAG: amidohydrolase family protein [Candidatus Hydrogenedentes bacterium]|nr:amidohydrolase family protein [Candidatus Hydrogenedentota bacterium]
MHGLHQTRRQFLKSAGAMTVVARAMRANAEESHGSQYLANRFVDVHTHITQAFGEKPPLSASELVAWMDKVEIGKAFVLPLVNPESWDHLISTEYVLRETEPYRERLIASCCIDPRANYLDSVEAKVKHLQRYIDAGVKGYGEHKCGVNIDDPRNIEVFAAAAELKLPILFHLDSVRNMDKPGLPGLAKVLESVPNGIFIGHANGWWASISGDATESDFGGYPNRKTTSGGAIDALMDRFPNIYGDLSAGSGSNAILRDVEFGREFLIRRADRLLFGTDYLMPGQKVPQISMYREIELSEDARAKIFRENAQRVFNL